MQKIIQIVSPASLIATLFVLSAVALSIFGGFISTGRPLSGLEASLVNGLTLVLGLFGSFLGGAISARKSAQEMVRPAARSAFRRVRSIYLGLGQIAEDIESFDRQATQQPENLVAIGRVEATVKAFLSTADDAMDEWHDLVPKDVEELYTSLRARSEIGRKREMRGES